MRRLAGNLGDLKEVSSPTEAVQCAAAAFLREETQDATLWISNLDASVTKTQLEEFIRKNLESPESLVEVGCREAGRETRLERHLTERGNLAGLAWRRRCDLSATFGENQRASPTQTSRLPGTPKRRLLRFTTSNSTNALSRRWSRGRRRIYFRVTRSFCGAFRQRRLKNPLAAVLRRSALKTFQACASFAIVEDKRARGEALSSERNS